VIAVVEAAIATQKYKTEAVTMTIITMTYWKKT